MAPAARTDVDPTTPSTTTETSPERPPGGLGLNGSAAAAESAAADASLQEDGQEGFVAATMAELRKVVWPSRQQLFSESVAVILMVSLSAAGIAAVDRLYRWISLQVFR